MAITISTGRLARASAGRARFTLGVWVMATVPSELSWVPQRRFERDEGQAVEESHG